MTLNKVSSLIIWSTNYAYLLRLGWGKRFRGIFHAIKIATNYPNTTFPTTEEFCRPKWLVLLRFTWALKTQKWKRVNFFFGFRQFFFSTIFFSTIFTPRYGIVSALLLVIWCRAAKEASLVNCLLVFEIDDSSWIFGVEKKKAQ